MAVKGARRSEVYWNHLLWTMSGTDGMTELGKEWRPVLHIEIEGSKGMIPMTSSTVHPCLLHTQND